MRDCCQSGLSTTQKLQQELDKTAERTEILILAIGALHIGRKMRLKYMDGRINKKKRTRAMVLIHGLPVCLLLYHIGKEGVISGRFNQFMSKK